MNYLMLSLLCLNVNIVYAQIDDLSVFEPFMGRTWSTEGQWGDGSAFKQDVMYRYSLDSALVLVETHGFIDSAQTALGLRSIGVRFVDPDTQLLGFHEYDTFGGITKGNINVESGAIYYDYNYGGTIITDAWLPLDKDSYQFIVGVRKDTAWHQKYLESICSASAKITNYKMHIAGSWTAEAWDGSLDEQWELNQHGQLQQSSVYTTNGTIAYAAKTSIQEIGGELLLISVIKDKDPKIYKLVAQGNDFLEFENSEYINPSHVRYQFINKNRYHRTISGTEDGEWTTYTFRFNRLD